MSIINVKLFLILLCQIRYAYQQQNETENATNDTMNVATNLLGTNNVVRYFDHHHFDDTFFDRLVSIVMNKPNFIGDDRKFKTISLGVFINSNTILTSYNAYSSILKNETVKHSMCACFLRNRTSIKRRIYYTTDCIPLEKYGRVINLNEDELPDELWHGMDKIHTPIHDLMIFRVQLEEGIVKMNGTENVGYTIATHHPKTSTELITYETGPYVTSLATSEDIIGRDVVFVTTGHKTKRRARVFYFLEKTEYEEDANVLEDCEEWLYKEWGDFICLRHDENFPGFGSGAMLFFNKTLYGVGSFTLWRGEKSILIFTDVRPYYDSIMNVAAES